MYGRSRSQDGREVGAPPPGQAWIAEGAAERLGDQPGRPRSASATAELIVGGIIDDEPDRLSEGFSLGADGDRARSTCPPRPA